MNLRQLATDVSFVQHVGLKRVNSARQVIREYDDFVKHWRQFETDVCTYRTIGNVLDVHTSQDAIDFPRSQPTGPFVPMAVAELSGIVEKAVKLLAELGVNDARNCRLYGIFEQN